MSHYSSSLEGLLNRRGLRWVFVGGKGGVGKTTCAVSIALYMYNNKPNKKIIIVSTDPAHNLSDVLNQKIGNTPTLVNGYKNLYALELDPKEESEKLDFLNFKFDQGNDSNNNNNNNNGFNNDIIKSLKLLQSDFPGVDEAVNLKYISKLTDDSDDNDNKYDMVIFDTAPTGHTLRFLYLPSILEQFLSKLLELRTYINGSVGNMINSILGGNGNDYIKYVFDNVLSLQSSVLKVAQRFKDPQKTTFVAVCIPELLSIYETERLVGKLLEEDIDIGYLIVNQILSNSMSSNKCKLCHSRINMQNIYLKKIEEDYEDFHVIKIPLQKTEIRGVENLNKLCKYYSGENQ